MYRTHTHVHTYIHTHTFDIRGDLAILFAGIVPLRVPKYLLCNGLCLTLFVIIFHILFILKIIFNFWMCRLMTNILMILTLPFFVPILLYEDNLRNNHFGMIIFLKIRSSLRSFSTTVCVWNQLYQQYMSYLLDVLANPSFYQ